MTNQNGTPLLYVDWSMEDIVEEDTDIMEEDQLYWQNSKVRRLMEGGDGQDET